MLLPGRQVILDFVFLFFGILDVYPDDDNRLAPMGFKLDWRNLRLLIIHQLHSVIDHVVTALINSKTFPKHCMKSNFATHAWYAINIDIRFEMKS